MRVFGASRPGEPYILDDSTGGIDRRRSGAATRARGGGFITGDGFANYRDRGRITGWHMARAFQKRVGDCLRVRKEPHNVL